MGTECSYDYVFVYDGDSFDAPLLGSFSGKTEPQNVTASSGYVSVTLCLSHKLQFQFEDILCFFALLQMLILLYSDTNYVLDGFRATYAIHNCPNNCTGRGLCVSHKCFCVVGVWGGPDCSVELCPNGCSGNGQCKGDGCQCKKGYVLHFFLTKRQCSHFLLLLSLKIVQEKEVRFGTMNRLITKTCKCNNTKYSLEKILC